jgi:hypothetical protein
MDERHKQHRSPDGPDHARPAFASVFMAHGGDADLLLFAVQPLFAGIFKAQNTLYMKTANSPRRGSG